MTAVDHRARIEYESGGRLLVTARVDRWEVSGRAYLAPYVWVLAWARPSHTPTILPTLWPILGRPVHGGRTERTPTPGTVWRIPLRDRGRHHPSFLPRALRRGQFPRLPSAPS